MLLDELVTSIHVQESVRRDVQRKKPQNPRHLDQIHLDKLVGQGHQLTVPELDHREIAVQVSVQRRLRSLDFRIALMRRPCSTKVEAEVLELRAARARRRAAKSDL